MVPLAAPVQPFMQQVAGTIQSSGPTYITVDVPTGASWRLRTVVLDLVSDAPAQLQVEVISGASKLLSRSILTSPDIRTAKLVLPKGTDRVNITPTNSITLSTITTVATITFSGVISGSYTV